MKLSDGLFLRCARKVAEGFPEIFYGEHIIDNTCMQLVMNPYQYDTLLLENLYGDIVSDLCAAFVGGLGLVPGANLGHECAIFEAVHGSAPDIAGKDLANPTALLQSAVLMLHHLDEEAAADKVQKALETVYAEHKTPHPRRRRHRRHHPVCRRRARCHVERLGAGLRRSPSDRRGPNSNSIDSEIQAKTLADRASIVNWGGTAAGSCYTSVTLETSSYRSDWQYFVPASAKADPFDAAQCCRLTTPRFCIRRLILRLRPLEF